MDAQRSLDLSIRLARKLEDTVNLIATKKKHTAIGYFTLVRNRRLAEGIVLLGETNAYEGQILLRSMIEIHINYAWIRCRKPTLRANRFFKFRALEQLSIADGLVESTTSPERFEEQRDLRRQRAAVRHLFQNRTGRGRLQWAKSCFQTTSLESRLKEVLSLEPPTENRGFLYTLYRWASSAVHGSPLSIDDVLDVTLIGVRAADRPGDTLRLYNGAAVVLFGTTQVLAHDLKALDDLEPEATSLREAFDQIR